MDIFLSQSVNLNCILLYFNTCGVSRGVFLFAVQKQDLCSCSVTHQPFPFLARSTFTETRRTATINKKTELKETSNFTISCAAILLKGN